MTPQRGSAFRRGTLRDQSFHNMKCCTIKSKARIAANQADARRGAAQYTNKNAEEVIDRRRGQREEVAFSRSRSDGDDATCALQYREFALVGPALGLQATVRLCYYSNLPR
jgi:hypothetical protein